jgi:transcriptional regulator with GAF, ATPase, and Fis domain
VQDYSNVPRNLLILFDDNPEETDWCEWLHEPIQCDSYVLALDMNETKLPFYKVWDWLRLGIKEIYSIADVHRLANTLSKRLQRWMFIEEVLESDGVKKVAIGNSRKWIELLQQIIEIACFSQSSLVLLGESGTGKELVARLLHDLDRRPDKQELVLLDCSTLVPELSGSEFFGHEKGSFTSAFSMREGAFGLADGGTLFLDEIGELPLSLQAGLLRVIQEGTYKRVGSNQWRKTNFRLVCATNRNLKQEVEQGRFREDLYYRISTNICTLPPLRERREDIPALAEYFLQEALQSNYAPPIDDYLRSFLLTHPYPGNVRELRQLMHRLAIRYPGEGPLTLGCLSLNDRDILPNPNSWLENDFKNAIRMALANGVSLKDIKRIAAETAMDIAIEESNSNLQVAAKRLDISDRVVQLHQANRRK